MYAGTRWRSLAFVSMAALVVACGGGGDNGTAADAGAPTHAPLSAPAALGEKIFADVSLSASGRQACATCHRADAGHAPANALAVQFGGPLGADAGRRQAPSIDYLAFGSAFAVAADGSPSGGFFWDGRAASLQQQATEPFFNAFEMANASAADLTARLARASYAEDFEAVFGTGIFGRPDDAVARVAFALAQYQKEDPGFRAFSSKYDEFLRGRATLTEAELRGLAAFASPTRGNCAACHPSGKSEGAGESAGEGQAALPLFTDFTYDNLGVPRNPAIARNADPAYFDLGLCERPELARRTDLCGAFKVPSLRNVAKRSVFFHNGRFGSLKEAVTFYVQRDTQPEKWYPRKADGSVDKFDDLPPAYRANVNTTEAPYDRRPGQAPALSDAEVDDVIAFLKTLDDGYRP